MKAQLEEQGVTGVELRPGRSGQFDIEIDGVLRYSRARSRGFPTEAEVDALLPP